MKGKNTSGMFFGFAKKNIPDVFFVFGSLHGEDPGCPEEAALAGVAWLGLYALAGWLQLDAVVPDPPTVGVLPEPFLLLAGGLVLGLLLAVVSAWAARVGARRRGRVMDRRLREAIGEVADAKILAPVQRVLDRHAATREALRRAAAQASVHQAAISVGCSRQASGALQ